MAEVFAGKKFLVVDDEPDLREILRDELEFAGAQLDEAENGIQAFSLAEKNDFDAIISDIRMPGGDGMTLAKKIKEQKGKAPVVFLVTGFADFTPAEAYEIGVEGFIYKPFNLGPVIDNLARVLSDESKRWTSEVKATNIKELAVKGVLTDLISKGAVRVGRGGLFVVGNFLEVRKDDVVRLTLADNVTITASVKWIQHDEADKTLPSGIGIEILQLSPAAMSVVMDWIGKNHPTSYIPRK